MSTALAIAGVSAVLQFYLNNMYTNLTSKFGGTVLLTAIAPDLVQQTNVGTTDPTENQVNLFLHQVTYNSAWRNIGLPSLGVDGSTLLKNPPLALDLHYLLTVYGTADWQAEGLLGYALLLLHENPVLSRSDIGYALGHLSSANHLSSALASCGLADQIEMIKITPATLGREEMAWLWTALKADYRPTFPFQVSVVLLQPQPTASLAIPVLRRQLQAQALQPPVILQVTPPNQQVAAAMSDPVTVTGEFLSAMTQVLLSNPRLLVQFPVPVSPSAVTAIALTFITAQQTLYPAGVPAGIYSLVARAVDSSGNVSVSTNSLQFALAPSLQTQTVAGVSNPDTTAPNTILVTVNDISPPVWQGQNVTLALTNLSVPAPPAPLFGISSQAQAVTGNNNTSLVFVFPDTLPLNTQFLARLIVDGVSSAVLIAETAATPPIPPTPSFSGPWLTVT